MASKVVNSSLLRFTERRLHPRQPGREIVLVRIRHSLAAEPTVAEPINVSRNGVLLLLDAPLDAGAELDLVFLHNSGLRLPARAVVRTVAERGFGRWQAGCQFDDPFEQADIDLFAK